MVVRRPDRWLIDKSAFVRLRASSQADEWLDRIRRGLVHIAVPTLLEIGFSATSAAKWDSLLDSPPVSAMPRVFATNRSEQRAIEVQGVLARRAQHRAPSAADLLIAAAAELHGLIVLHVDKDFDLIADVTGQRVERLVLDGEH